MKGSLDRGVLVHVDRWLGRYQAAPFLRRYAPVSQVDSAGMSPLERVYHGQDGREVTKWRDYLPIYEAELGRFRDRPIRLLEIGVQNGGSLQIWRKYLGAPATIFGIDIDHGCGAFDSADLPVRIGSQSDPQFLRRVVEEMGGLDIVIDDGSHVGADQIASFRTLFPLVSIDGIYIIEDVHTSYWREYDGGVDRDGTVMAFMKDLIDDLHGWYHDRQAMSFTDARQHIGRITFYDSLIAMTRVERTPPQQVAAGRVVVEKSVQ